MWKVLSGVASLFALVAAAFSYFNYNAHRVEKQLADRAQQHLATAIEHKNAADQKLADEKDFLATVTGERDKAQEDLATAKTDLTEAETALEEKEETLTSKTEELAQMEDKLKSVGELEVVQTTLRQLETQLLELDEQIASLNNTLTVALAEKKDTESTIEAYKAKVADQNAGRMPSVRARVNSVFDGWGFVVIGAGNRSGMVSQAKLDVVRGGSVVGQVEVTNVEPSTSVAKILRDTFAPGDTVQPGDSVTVASDSLARAPQI